MDDQSKHRIDITVVLRANACACAGMFKSVCTYTDVCITIECRRVSSYVLEYYGYHRLCEYTLRIHGEPTCNDQLFCYVPEISLIIGIKLYSMLPDAEHKQCILAKLRV